MLLEWLFERSGLLCPFNRRFERDRPEQSICKFNEEWAIFRQGSSLQSRERDTLEQRGATRDSAHVQEVSGTAVDKRFTLSCREPESKRDTNSCHASQLCVCIREFTAAELALPGTTAGNKNPSLPLPLPIPTLPAPLQYLKSFRKVGKFMSMGRSSRKQTPQMRRPKRGEGKRQRITMQWSISSTRCCIVQYKKKKSLRAELQQTQSALQELHERQYIAAEEGKALEDLLGIKYKEYAPLCKALKRRLLRVVQNAAQAVQLEIALKTEMPPTKWDAIHDPQNVAAVVLQKDSLVWRSVSPRLDLALVGGRSTVYTVSIAAGTRAGDCPPRRIVLSSSMHGKRWMPVVTFDWNMEGGSRQTFQIRGDPTECKFISLKMSENTRGGQMVALRNVEVFGVSARKMMAQKKVAKRLWKRVRSATEEGLMPDPVEEKQ